MANIDKLNEIFCEVFNVVVPLLEKGLIKTAWMAGIVYVNCS